MIFQGGINVKAWLFAEMEDAVRRSEQGLTPFRDDKGRQLIEFQAGERLDSDEIEQWKSVRQTFLYHEVNGPNGNEFLIDLARVRDWIATGRQAYDYVGTAAFKIMTDVERLEGRLPTIKEMNGELAKLGITPPTNWARWAKQRSIFKRMKPGKREGDRRGRTRSPKR